jgi:hypothetical protein
MREPDFAQQIALTYAIHKSNVNRAAELTAISTALGTDVTTHDMTIQAPAAALRILTPPVHSRFTNDINLIVNKGKGGNLSNASMIAAIDIVLSIASKPGVVDVPYASANANPPIVGTVCSVTNGNWVGTPTSYSYQWTRNGTAIGGATAATYTLVSADTGGKDIRCVVTATNAQGSTTAPPSNLIRVP